MKQSRRRRKRVAQSSKRNDSGGGVVSGGNGGCGSEEEQRMIGSLIEVFSLASIEEARSAYKEANGDPNKAAEILSELAEKAEVFESSSLSELSGSCGMDSSSSSSSGQSFSCSESSGSGSGVGGDGGNGSWGCRGGRGKKVVATAGTVSSLLGKDYVPGSARKEVVKEKGGGKVNIEEAEDFLYSMLGDDCELSMAVIKDVLCNCGYDVQKALEGLLDLSASHCEPSGSDQYSSSSAASSDYPSNLDCSDNFWQLSGSDSYSHSSESDSQDSVQLFDYTGRNYAEALISSDSSRKQAITNPRADGKELPRQVLESLFNVPKSSERESSTLNWKNVVTQMESFAQKHVELGPPGLPEAVPKGDEYQVFRETARQEWGKMRTCYQKAATAYSTGERNYATYMSEQGKVHNKMARDAEEKASMEIFKARNKGIENLLTIDLHGQHVKPAMRLVKLHILFATYISSVQHIRIITGCGSHGLGKSILKQSVINLFKREGIVWKEENQGTVLIKLDGPREFSFKNSGSDSESD